MISRFGTALRPAGAPRAAISAAAAMAACGPSTLFNASIALPSATCFVPARQMTAAGWMAAKKRGDYVAPKRGEEGWVERPQKRLAFPTQLITMQLERTADMKRHSKFGFIIPPSMSKWELKEILTKLYDVDVVSVNTANYEGKMKRWQRRAAYKEKDYKKAIVRLQPRFPGDTFGLPADF